MELIMPKRRTETVLQRLMRRSRIPTNKDGTHSKTKCWTWTGPTNNAGYGMMRGKLKMGTVHRIMYFECIHTDARQYGSKNEVLHKCGNKLCVNPDHLMTGDINDRAELQRKYKAYNKNFGNPDYMWRKCEHCGHTDYLPHFKRKHSLCNYLSKHKYST